MTRSKTRGRIAEVERDGQPQHRPKKPDGDCPARHEGVGVAGNHRLPLAISGSPTWARTRDLRINRTALPQEQPS